MSKIVLDSIVSGYDLSKINANFQKLQTELNEKVLYRNAPTGEPNSLENDIDVNGKNILNVGSLSVEGYPDLTSIVVEANAAKDAAVAAKNVVVGVEDEFTDIYLGNKSADPIIDNDGNPLIEGCFYFNVALSPKRLRVYNGVGWQDAAASVTNVVNSIDNSLYPSQVEAEAGVNDVKVMTPLRVKQSLLVNAATLAQGALADSAIQPDDVGTSAGKIVALDGSGKLPAVDGSQLANLPTELPSQTGNQGKFLKTDGSTPSWSNTLTSGSAINTTSGTAHDFTGIPAGVKRITLMLSGVSTNSTGPLLLQLGSAGGIEATGYVGMVSLCHSSGVNTFTGVTTGAALVHSTMQAADTCYGSVILTNISGNTWVISGEIFSTSSLYQLTPVSGKTLSGVLSRIRLTTLNGTDLFDAGQINILYE